MTQTAKTSIVKRCLGSGKGAAVALSFFLIGLVVASNYGLTKPIAAEPTAVTEQTTKTTSMAPNSFAELARQLSPTVVNIKVTKLAKVSGWQFPQTDDHPFGEFFKRFFQDQPQAPRQFKQRGAGSGVIISADGYIVTNNHVIEAAEEVAVTLADQREYQAEIVGRDAKTDLAVLKIASQKLLPVATMGDSDALMVGEWVLAIGNPFGLGHTVTSGIVSGKGRVIGAGPYDDFIQTDASINPGNSGGPLFNMQGEVIGINTAIIPHGQGIGFAIPVNTAKPLIPQLMSTGEVIRGYLGVTIQSISPELVNALGLHGRQGALVADVVPDSPAEQAGIERGDVIVNYNGKAIGKARDLPPMAARTPVGETVTVTVLRDGTPHELPLTVGKLATSEPQAAESNRPAKGVWGLHLRTLTPDLAGAHDLAVEQGVLVIGVQPDSPAAGAKIQAGDVILEVNRHPVTSVQDVKEVIGKAEDADSLLLLVKRGRGGDRFVALAK